MTKIKALIAVLMISLPLFSAVAKAPTVLEGVINVNTASPEELMRLPGVGPSKAEAIITFRQAHPFKDVAELTEVKGIGPKMLEKIKNYVRIDGVTNLKETSGVSLSSAATPVTPAAQK